MHTSGQMVLNLTRLRSDVLSVHDADQLQSFHTSFSSSPLQSTDAELLLLPFHHPFDRALYQDTISYHLDNPLTTSRHDRNYQKLNLDTFLFSELVVIPIDSYPFFHQKLYYQQQLQLIRHLDCMSNHDMDMYALSYFRNLQYKASHLYAHMS